MRNVLLTGKRLLVSEFLSLIFPYPKKNNLKPTIFLSITVVLFAGLIHPFSVKEADHGSMISPDIFQPSVKLYVLDGGTIENIEVTGFGLKREETSATRLPVPCFLIVHPKGTLIWDAGAVPDSSWKYTGTAIKYKLVLPDRQRDISLTKPLKTQLAEIGYSPANIYYIALSHYHYDHTANANDFENSTWFVRQNEYDTMFSLTPPNGTRPSSYSALRKRKTQFLNSDEYDVFGDGTVIIKSAPGHTPGHIVLFVKLAKTGNVVLSGDLYHLAEERILDRVPTFEFNKEETRATRVIIDAFLKKNNAQLWIQHDPSSNEKLKKSPAYYD